MENSKNKKGNRIQLCADEFLGDAWAEYCAICNAPSGTSSITIWFDDGDIEYDCDDEEDEEGKDPKPKATKDPKHCPFPDGGLTEVEVVEVDERRGGAMELGYPHYPIATSRHQQANGKPSYINPKDIIACYPCSFEPGHELVAQNRSGWKLILRGHTEPIYCLESPLDRHTGLTVKATVTFQRWEGDVARFNGEAEFDACDALDSMDDEQLAQVERNDPWALDSVYTRAVMFGQIHDYDGPFEVELDEDNLSDYLEARRNGR